MAVDLLSEGVAGVARYIRVSEPDAAEVAVMVIDDWQRKGLAAALLGRLTARAREAGIMRLTGVTLVHNAAALELMRHLGPARVVRRDGATVEIEAEIVSADSARPAPAWSSSARPRGSGRAAPSRAG